MVENGTDLYEAFQIYFADQKVLFKNKADSEYALFVKYLTDLEDEGFTSLTEIANKAAASATAAKTSETNSKTSETACQSLGLPCLPYRLYRPSHLEYPVPVCRCPRRHCW